MINQVLFEKPWETEGKTRANGDIHSPIIGNWRGKRKFTNIVRDDKIAIKWD